ncbi:MAG: helix-turn-helix transcriptional regulator [Candidatus Sumerlaeia bacterium]|nr:helix-turn-helix transcriptional regulator [Candidatus Sumerlaeia bacterium]
MSSNFFSEALRQGMRERHFNQAQLAEFLQVDPAYISRWLKGSSPRLEQLRSVLELLGWHLGRARPDYDPFADAINSIDHPESGEPQSAKEKARKYSNMKEVKSLLEEVAKTQRQPDSLPLAVSGSLNAITGESKLAAAGEVMDSLSNNLKLIDFAETSLYAMRVDVSGPGAFYPQGTILILRKVLRPSGVPTKSIVLMEPVATPGTYHLRQLVRLRDESVNRVDRLIGAPLSAEQDYLYFKPREVRIHSVVVAHFRANEFEAFEELAE